MKTKDVRPGSGELIKPREIIEIAGIEGWSLADRRTWNLLLHNAWGNRLDEPNAEFQIPLRELRGHHDSNDRVRESLERLQTTLVRATFPNKTVRTVQMLGATDIRDEDRKEGVLTYDFHHKLVPILRDSEVYARMELHVLRSFTSKYALGLYEVIAARINMRKTTEAIEVATLRQWLGVQPGKLERWPDLNRKALQPALREVNGLSPYTVEVEPITRGRKVSSIRVSWSKKPPFSPAEQAAAREVNRARPGRRARLSGTVENPVPELTPEEIQKGYAAAAPIHRLDKHAAYEAWKTRVASLPALPRNPGQDFIEFCIERARDPDPLVSNE